MPKPILIPQNHIQKIVSLYQSGLSLKEVSSAFPQYKVGVIYRLLKRENVMRHGSDSKRKYVCDKEYFETINSEDKAYWLGFLYADGYIVNGIKGKNKDAVGLTLAKRDVAHLEKFKKAIHATHPIHVYKTFLNTFSCRIIIQDEEFAASLIKKGVLRNKSLKLTFPNSSIVPEEFVFHFMRGYFDGDGSFSKKGAGVSGYDFKLLGTKEFLDVYRSHLGVSNKIVKAKKCISTNVYTLCFGGNRKVKNAADKLYANAHVFLERKYERYKELQIFS